MSWMKGERSRSKYDWWIFIQRHVFNIRNPKITYIITQYCVILGRNLVKIRKFAIFANVWKTNIIGHDLDKTSKVKVKFWLLNIYLRTCLKHHVCTKQVHYDTQQCDLEQQTGQNLKICNFQKWVFLRHRKIMCNIYLALILFFASKI